LKDSEGEGDFDLSLFLNDFDLSLFRDDFDFKSLETH